MLNGNYEPYFCPHFVKLRKAGSMNKGFFSSFVVILKADLIFLPKFISQKKIPNGLTMGQINFAD